MINKKQSSVEFIFNAFNLLSDADFKAWMLNNHDDIKAMHEKEIIKASARGYIIASDGFPLQEAMDYAKQYYNETFGGQDNEN